MPTDSMIMDAASKQAFTRGEDLVSTGAVQSVDVQHEPSGSRVALTGTVRDRGTSYSASVDLDLERERVCSHRCTCSASVKLGEFCKHCVALSLAYLDKGSSEREASVPASPELIARLKAQTQDLLAQYRAESQQRQSMASTIQEPQTSPQITRAVWACAEAAQRQKCAVQTPSPLEQPLVELYPLLAPGPKIKGDGRGLEQATWELRLRIGDGSSIYLVKQIDGLVQAWESRTERSYGRNLSFVHDHGAFSERANRLLALLASVLHTQAAVRAASHAFSSQNAFTGGSKSLALSDADAAQLLDIMMGSEVQFEPHVFSGTAKPRTLSVVEGDPVLPITINTGERGGFDLHLPAGADCIVTEDHLYVLHDKRAWRCSPSMRTRMGSLLRSLLPTGQPLHIRQSDMPAFCGSVLPVLKEIGTVDAPAELDAMLPPIARPRFSCTIHRNHVICDATVAYGDATVNLFDPPLPGQPLRDIQREEACRSVLKRFFTVVAPDTAGRKTPTAETSHPSFDIHDTQALYRFLSEGLRTLNELGELRVSEQLRSIGIRPSPHLRLSASIRSGLLDIAVDSSDLSPQDLQAYLRSFERKERFVRLSNGDLVRLDAELRSLAEMAADLGVSAFDLLSGARSIPANCALFVDAMLQRCPGVTFDKDETFYAIVQAFDALGTTTIQPPQSLQGILRPYQREGFSWMSTLASLGFGGILADDMGLGKTLQVITFLLSQHEMGCPEPSLVVCPASLVYNWKAEFERFAPDLAVAIVAGTPEERRACIQAARSYDVLVTSYELLKRDVELYVHHHFYCHVLDEAQYIKNHATQAARCVKRVPATVRLALTGTPIENRLSELWSIFDFLMPGLLGGYEAFRRRFEAPIAEGDEETSARLQCMVSPFILRRMKGDVLQDLPEKTESIVYASMEGEQDKLYRATASQLALTLAHQLPGSFAADRIAILAELTKLRQICCDPHLLYSNYEGESAKLETCLELVRNAVDAGHKVLLFSQFTSMLAIIAEHLTGAGITHYQLIGSTPKEERARLVASFQTDNVPVFLVSLKAGGVGLNLTAADIVIHYDPWWNMAAQNQATDRAHRIGQTNTVNVMRLIAKGTIEEKIVQLQEAKRDLADRIIGGEAIGSAQLTREDILALLE